MPSIPKLTILVGLSGSGKSTYAKESNAVVISSDNIRKELIGDEANQEQNEQVFQLFHQRIKETLSSGKDTVVDATNLTMKSRRAILSTISHIPCEKKAVLIIKPIEECIKDNNSRIRKVPTDIIYHQLKHFQVPFYEEGFDNISIIYNNIPELTYFDECIKKMKYFDQKNPHHNETLGDHCNTVAINFNYTGGYYLGALYHDIGKLFTQTFDKNGIAHYYNHENVGSYYFLCYSKTLNTMYSKKEIIDASFIINYHMRPFNWNNEKTHKKYKNLFGEEKYQLLMDFHECDQMKENDKKEEEREYE